MKLSFICIQTAASLRFYDSRGGHFEKATSYLALDILPRNESKLHDNPLVK